MSNTLKKTVTFMVIGIFLLLAYGSEDSKNDDSKQSETKSESAAQADSKDEFDVQDLVGKTIDLDTYHRIQFKTSSRYWIYQRPLSCGGEGNWSIQNGKIVLGPNDSGCESTQNMKGSYEYSQLK